MQTFDPVSALFGGIMIGLAASLLLVACGRVAGISGMISGILVRTPGDVAHRAVFLAGLIAAGVGAALFSPASIGAPPRHAALIAIAGVLVGAGTRLGNGCTSGHGVCGVSRLSPRSLSATAVFLTAGVLSVALFRVVGGLP